MTFYISSQSYLQHTLILPLISSQDCSLVSKTEYLTSTNTLGCLNLASAAAVFLFNVFVFSWPSGLFFKIGVTEGHHEEGKVSCPRQVGPSFPSFREQVWLTILLKSSASEGCCCGLLAFTEAFRRMHILWRPTTLWWFPKWKSTRKTGLSLGT